MRVLLVEDDLTAAHGVSLMLKSVGAVVEHGTSWKLGMAMPSNAIPGVLVGS